MILGSFSKAGVDVLEFEVLVGQNLFTKNWETIANEKEIAFSRTFPIFKEYKAQSESSMHSFLTKIKELSSHHKSLFTHKGPIIHTGFLKHATASTCNVTVL